MRETAYARECRLRREERATAQAIYGEWRHPDNVRWAAARYADDGPSLRERYYRLEERLRAAEAALNRQHVADEVRRWEQGGEREVRSMPSEYLEDIAMPGHRDRPAMSLGDRLWLIDARNRQTIERLWDRLTSATTIIGGYGCIDGDLLEEDGVPETLVSHWRTIDYTDAGERIVSIPGGMIARDLALLGLGREAVEQGTVVTPQRRPALIRRHPVGEPVKAGGSPHKSDNAPQAVAAFEPVLIFRRSKGVARGS